MVLLSVTTRRRALLGMVTAATLVVGLGAIPARAGTGGGATQRGAASRALSPNARVHLMPTRSVARSIGISDAAAAAPVNFQYWFGPVMASPTRTVPIFWEPSTLQGGEGATVDPSYNSLLLRFLQDVGGHGLYNNLTQYYQSLPFQPRRHIVNSSGVLQAIVDTSPYPAAAGGCLADGMTNCMTDDQLQAEIAADITAGALPVDYRTMYIVFTDPGESSCLDAVTCFDPSSLFSTNWVYCAYHGIFTMGGQPVVYANMPYVDTNPLSVMGCGASSDPNSNTAFDDETPVLSHEFNEAITDPNPSMGGWFDNGTGYEIGDICNGKMSQVTWAAHVYVVQKEWSNATRSCVSGRSGELSLNAAGGPAGSTVRVLGHGFLGREKVGLRFTDATGLAFSLGTARSNASGAISRSVIIPVSAAAGAGTVGATGATPGDGASAGYTVGGVGTYRPDAQVGLRKLGPWAGNDVYDSTGLTQTRTRSVSRGGTVVFWMRFQNDGTVVDTFTLSSGPAGFAVYQVGSSVVTARVRAGTFRRRVAAGSWFRMRIVIRAKSGAPTGKVFAAKIHVVSSGDPTLNDVVIASAKVA